MTYKLMNGDCRELLKDIPEESVDLLLTDCPYRIVQGGCSNKKANTGIFSKENAEKGKLFDCNDIEFSEWLPLVYRVMKQRTHAYIMVNGRNLASLQEAAENAGFTFQNLLVWEKGNVTPNRYYMNACEFVLMLRKGCAKSIKNRGDSTILKAKTLSVKSCTPLKNQ